MSYTIVSLSTERVSYKVPIFHLKEDDVALSVAKRHCGFHPMSKAIPVAMKDELEAAGIGISGTTLDTRPGIDLPMSLVEKVLRRRPAEVAARLSRTPLLRSSSLGRP